MANRLVDNIKACFKEHKLLTEQLQAKDAEIEKLRDMLQAGVPGLEKEIERLKAELNEARIGVCLNCDAKFELSNSAAMNIVRENESFRERMAISNSFATSEFARLDDSLKAKTAEIEQLTDEFRRCFDAMTKAQERVKMLKSALINVDKALTVPAAEYVPAISDAFTIIDKALKAVEGK